ncbi:hypothetical protein CYMTET_21588, partial [Cymbomonas tetramitiformis]
GQGGQDPSSSGGQGGQDPSSSGGPHDSTAPRTTDDAPPEPQGASSDAVSIGASLPGMDNGDMDQRLAAHYRPPRPPSAARVRPAGNEPVEEKAAEVDSGRREVAAGGAAGRVPLPTATPSSRAALTPSMQERAGSMAPGRVPSMDAHDVASHASLQSETAMVSTSSFTSEPRGGHGPDPTVPSPQSAGAGAAAAPMQMQMQMFQRMLDDSLGALRAGLHEEIQNLHLELLRQFHLQSQETAEMVEELYSRQDVLMEEVKQLRKLHVQQYHHLHYQAAQAPLSCAKLQAARPAVPSPPLSCASCTSSSTITSTKLRKLHVEQYHHLH